MNFSSRSVSTLDKPTKRKTLLMIADVLAFIAAFVSGGAIGYIVNVYIFNADYNVILFADEITKRGVFFFLLAGLTLSSLHRQGRYTRIYGNLDNFILSTRFIIAAIAIDAIIQYTTKQSFSRLWLFGSWGISAMLLPISFWTTRYFLQKLRMWNQSIVFVGDPHERKRVAKALNITTERRYNLVGEFPLPVEDGNGPDSQLALAVQAAQSQNAKLIIAVGADQVSKVLGYCYQLERNQVEYVVSPDLGSMARSGLLNDVVLSGGEPFLGGPPRISHPYSRFLKRAMDMLLSLAGLVLLSPMMALIALMIKSDGGPILYRHLRVGCEGRPFFCLKFRTMRQNADSILADILEKDPAARAEWDKDFKLRLDPRITLTGRFLRKSSLDELPQLINVFMGDMSLVGPRPVVSDELDKYYGVQEREVYTRVRPGITGLWQVSGRNDTGYKTRVELDTRYARTWTIALDMWIILHTFRVLLSQRGAY